MHTVSSSSYGHPSEPAPSSGKRSHRWSFKRQVVTIATVAVLGCFVVINVALLPYTASVSTESPAKCVDCTKAAVKKEGPVSPKATQTVKPFRDLCAWLTGTHVSPASRAAAAKLSVDNTADAELGRQLLATLSKYDHIPADGGAAGVRWSAATGLPVVSTRTGEVKVRFLTVSNRFDPMLHFASVTAAMAGVRLEMIGMGWKHFTFVKRISLMLSYAEQENLTASDILVGTDADAVMSGEDAEGFFAAFVASTAESEAEHMTYSLRDIRTGKRLTPLLFSGESSCWHWATFSRRECPGGYQKVYDVREKWVSTANVSLQRGFNDANPFKFLNAGVMVSRVWALRLLHKLFLDFAKAHPPRRVHRGAKHWWCDQSAFGGMYLDLLRWEVESRALDGTPKALTEAQWKHYLYPSAVPPNGFIGPHGVPAGFLGVDQSTRLSMTIEPLMDGKSWFEINDAVVHSVNNPVPALQAALAHGMPLETSAIGVVRSQHRLRLTPRPKVDCVGVSAVPPECAYRDAVLGIPAGSTAVAPLLWHFAGKHKDQRYVAYRAVFPWYTPTVLNATALDQLVHVMANLPPTRVFTIDAATDTSAYLEDVALRAHNSADDVSTAGMCRATVLKA